MIIGHIWHRGGTFWQDNRKQLRKKGVGRIGFFKGVGQSKTKFQRGGQFYFSKVGQTNFPEENENAGPEVTQVMTSSKFLK